jgi:DNA-directed RNA polymerase
MGTELPKTNADCSVEEKSLLQQQLEELVKVGVGGKFKNQNTEDYVRKIEEEIAFEEAMIRGGITRYQKLIKDAVVDSQESTTLYGIVLQQKYITELSKLINKEVESMTSGVAGNRQTALKLMCQCLPKSAFINEEFITNNPNVWDTVSLIALKNVIDGISAETTLNKLAIKLGTALMLEAKITIFKDEEKEKYNQVAKRLTGKNMPQNANRYLYKRKVWTYCMNKHNLQFDDWSKESQLHLGVKIVSLCEQLGLVRHQNRKSNKIKTICYVEATPKIIEEIKNFNIKNEALYPKYLPMLMPPREWENPFVGGYYGKKHNYKQQSAKEISQSINKENK